MSTTHSYRVPTRKLVAGHRIYAALDSPAMEIVAIGDEHNRFRHAAVRGRPDHVSMPAGASYLVATKEEHDAIMAREEGQ